MRRFGGALPALRQRLRLRLRHHLTAGRCALLPGQVTLTTIGAALEQRSNPVQWSHASAVQQQVRKYAPASATASAAGSAKCWNCQKPTVGANQLICPSCGHLQDVNPAINYFDLLSFPKSFTVEPQELTKRFRQLQTIVHPDKFSNKSEREQLNSAAWSALINRAYKTLATPLERGQYILNLHGEQIPVDNSALNKEFLMEMMERNEQVEEAATTEALQGMNDQIVIELKDKIARLNVQFQANALDNAKATLVEMKYLLSMQNNIKKRLQGMMGQLD